jgi:hypothetical protein
MKYLLITIIMILVFTGCKDETAAGLPVIDIISPTTGQMISSGDSVRLFFNVSHEDDLHEITVELINDDMDFVAWDSTIHTHGQNYSFDQKQEVNVSVMTNMLLRVTAEDHNDITAQDSVAFMFHP